MRRILLILMIFALVFIACNSSDGPVMEPSFVTWCDTCVRHTEWGVRADYFDCVICGAVWNPLQEAKL